MAIMISSLLSELFRIFHLEEYLKYANTREKKTREADTVPSTKPVSFVKTTHMA